MSGTDRKRCPPTTASWALMFYRGVTRQKQLFFAVLMQKRPLHELFLCLIRIRRDPLQRQDRETSSLINSLPGCQWFLVREDVALIAINDCKIVVIWISAGVLLPNPVSVGMLINWFIVKSNWGLLEAVVVVSRSLQKWASCLEVKTIKKCLQHRL